MVFTRSMISPVKKAKKASPPPLKKKVSSNTPWQAFFDAHIDKESKTKNLLRKIIKKVKRSELDVHLLYEGIMNIRDSEGFDMIRTLENRSPCQCYVYDGHGYDHILCRDEYFWKRYI